MFESTLGVSNQNPSVTMKKPDGWYPVLTAREHEVLLLLAKGMNRDEIAGKLFISPETVKMHISNTYKKLNAKNKIDALLKMKML